MDAQPPRIAGLPIVLGVPDVIPKLIGFPEGKLRLRLRNKSVAHAFVKTTTSIRQFLVIREHGYWTAGPEVGRNIRPISPMPPIPVMVWQGKEYNGHLIKRP